jgi:hypothetical protein
MPSPDTIYLMANGEVTAETFTATDRKILTELALKMDYALRDMEELKRAGNKRHDDLRDENIKKDHEIEMRVRTLENFRWWLIGAVAIVSPIMAGLTSWLVNKISQH